MIFKVVHAFAEGTSGPVTLLRCEEHVSVGDVVILGEMPIAQVVQTLGSGVTIDRRLSPGLYHIVTETDEP